MSMQEHEFENLFREAAILSRPQYINQCDNQWLDQQHLA